jgi:hypothetical protein
VGPCGYMWVGGKANIKGRVPRKNGWVKAIWIWSRSTTGFLNFLNGPFLWFFKVLGSPIKNGSHFDYLFSASDSNVECAHCRIPSILCANPRTHGWNKVCQ